MTRERTPSNDGADTSRDGSLSRRRYLTLTGLAGTGALAGCGGGGDATPSEAASSETPDETTPSATPDGETPSATPETGFEAAFLDRSPSSSFAPTAGFGSADWLAAAEDLSVVKVTTLDASGEGSLPWALAQSGPRVIVFEVGGVVDLAGRNLNVDQSDAYVAGQTAPSPGITVIRGGIEVEAPNVVVQHIRVRPGDRLTDGPLEGEPTGNAVDALSAGNDRPNIILDHCSVSWGSDENMSAGGGEQNKNVTFSNNLIAECLSQTPLHEESEHSKAMLINDHANRTAAIGNVYVHNTDRHPRIKGGSSCAVVNNLVYNFGEAYEMGGGPDEDAVATIIGNHFIGGPATDGSVKMVLAEGYGARAYVAYNKTENPSLARSNNRLQLLSERPLWPADLTSIATDDVYDHNLATAGARPADRTPHDERIVTNVRERRGEIIDSQSEVGGYPELESTQRSLDVPDPGDGLAEWIAQHTRAVEVPDASAP